MKSFLTGVLLILFGILIASLIWLTASPPRGEPVTLLPPPTPLPIVVHVEGAVANPGLVHLPSDSRVQAALETVGGPWPEADLTHLNLAAPLMDGTQIRVLFSRPVPLLRQIIRLKHASISTRLQWMNSPPSKTSHKSSALAHLQ